MQGQTKGADMRQPEPKTQTMKISDVENQLSTLVDAVSRRETSGNARHQVLAAGFIGEREPGSMPAESDLDPFASILARMRQQEAI
jgi:hypothetical protein